MSIELDLTAAEHLADTAKIALEEALALYEAAEGGRTVELAMNTPKPTREMILAVIAQDKVKVGTPVYEAWRMLTRAKALSWRANSKSAHLKRMYFDAARHYA